MPDGVDLIIQNAARKYLLQMRDGADGIPHPLQWDFFGGGVEDGESPFAAAVREFLEELGHAPTKGALRMLGAVPQSNARVFVIAYEVPLEWGEFRVLEGAGAGFFTKAEMPKISLVPHAWEVAERFL